MYIVQAVTSTAVKKGGLYSLDVASAYKYKNTLVDVKVDTESNVSDIEYSDLCFPSLKPVL